MSEILNTLVLGNIYLLSAVFLIINIIAFFLFGFDKYQAKHRRFRIPENILLGISLLGGALGGLLGMRLFRHKTMRLEFSLGIPLIFLVQGLLILLCIIFLLT